jgi:hypothetical protein
LATNQINGRRNVAQTMFISVVNQVSTRREVRANDPKNPTLIPAFDAADTKQHLIRADSGILNAEPWRPPA